MEELLVKHKQKLLKMGPFLAEWGKKPRPGNGQLLEARETGTQLLRENDFSSLWYAWLCTEMDKLNATPLDHGLTHALDYVGIFESADANNPRSGLHPSLLANLCRICHGSSYQ
jgi:hypothetical protein